MAIQIEVIEELRAIVGDEQLRDAAPADAIDGVQPRYVVEPGSADEVAHVLRLCNDAALRIAPRGGGSKLAWGSPPHGVDLVLSTQRLDRVLEHAWGDMTATVEAGCTVATLQRTLGAHGQRLAIDPLWPEQATIGGIIATNDSGSLRQRFGGLRDLIIGIKVALPDGTLAMSGGKVVKNVAGYDLPKLMTGAWGTLGVITEATFRLYPLSHDTRTCSFAPPTTAAANEFLLKILDSTLVPTGLQLRADKNDLLEVDVRFEGSAAAIDAQATVLDAIARTVEARTVAPNGAWTARNDLWDCDGVICKLTFLPADMADVVAAIERVATPLHADWQLVAQAVGTAIVRLHVPNEQATIVALSILRSDMQRLQGTLVMLKAPVSLKARVDVWGYNGDALPLMCRIRQRFDPTGILNPGRFLGL